MTPTSVLVLWNIGTVDLGLNVSVMTSSLGALPGFQSIQMILDATFSFVTFATPSDAFEAFTRLQFAKCDFMAVDKTVIVDYAISAPEPLVRPPPCLPGLRVINEFLSNQEESEALEWLRSESGWCRIKQRAIVQFPSTSYL
jgi:hypothetical protein